jgi:DNA-binding XRE family transcriptional regulator
LLQVLVTKYFYFFMSFPLIMNEERDKKRLKDFGDHLRKIRESKNLSQDDVVKACDLTKGNLSMIENGNKDFFFTTLLELAKGLNVPAKALLDF